MEGNAQFCSRYRGSNNTSLLFRSTTSICQPLRHFVPPRNATGHGRGRGLKVVFQFRYEDTLCTSPLCFATQNIGEVARSDGGINSTEMSENIREIPARRRAQILQSIPMHSPYIADLSQIAHKKKKFDNTFSPYNSTEKNKKTVR